MTRRTDLEESMRSSYQIIREYEQAIQTSDRPEEKQRARREVEKQWQYIEGCLAEYRKLVAAPWAEEIAELAAHFTVAAPATGGPAAGSTTFDQRGQHVQTQINVAGDYVVRGQEKED